MPTSTSFCFIPLLIAVLVSGLCGCPTVIKRVAICSSISVLLVLIHSSIHCTTIIVLHGTFDFMGIVYHWLNMLSSFVCFAVGVPAVSSCPCHIEHALFENPVS